MSGIIILRGLTVTVVTNTLSQPPDVCNVSLNTPADETQVPPTKMLSP